MRIFLIIAIMAACFPALAQNDVKVSKIGDNLYMLVSPKGGNVVAATGSDGVFIIDDQLTGRSENIQQAIQTISDQPVKFILNTHYHFDHSGGNEFFGGKGAIIVAHDNVRKRLGSEQFISYFKRQMPALAKEGLPVVTFASEITLHYNDDDIRIIHVPHGHTDGDSAAYFTKENVIVAGDLIFNGMYPFIDLEHGGSIKGVIAGLDALLPLADDKTVIVPGHGPAMNRAELAKYRDMLDAIAKRVEAAIKAGKTKEQAVAEKPTREFDGNMSEGIVSPDAFTEIIYEDLKK